MMAKLPEQAVGVIQRSFNQRTGSHLERFPFSRSRVGSGYPVHLFPLVSVRGTAVMVLAWFYQVLHAIRPSVTNVEH